jgi:hydrogenase nickel incorporation protein HypA/HybF
VHEVGLVEGAILKAVAVMDAAGASSVERLTFAIAPGGHVTPQGVQTLFSALSVGTPAQGAELAFEMLDQQFGCWGCGHTFTSSEGDQLCPSCGGSSVKPLPAGDLVLKFVDVADLAGESPTFTPR